MYKKFLIIDFDSTFVKLESLDELAKIALKGNCDALKIAEEIQQITNLGMEGKIGFDESLQRRLALFKPYQNHVDILVELLRVNITKSFRTHEKFIRSNAENIYIISGGFKDYIFPVVKEFGIAEDHVLANNFIFDNKGNYIGIDTDNFLAWEKGKVKAIENLKLDGEVIVVGDGITDYQIKEHGFAKLFIAFNENIARVGVNRKADKIASNFDDIVGIIETSSAPKALLLENIDITAVETLEKAGFDVDSFPHALSEVELIKIIPGYSVIGIRSKTQITKNVLKHASKLKMVGAFCIGINHIDVDDCSKREVTVFNAPYSNTRSVVELVIGDIIMLARGVFDKSENLHHGIWEKSAKDSYEIRGKKLGIIGYGNIGTQLSQIAQCLGMDVCFYDLEDKMTDANTFKCQSMEELLQIADIITIHVDGRRENTNLIDQKEFKQMKDGVLFLNLSRGHVVNLDALADNIKNGKVLGAAVDVYTNEPDKNGEGFKTPLQGLPNVILTPHVGGSTKEAQKAIAQYVSNKITKYFASLKLIQDGSVL